MSDVHEQRRADQDQVERTSELLEVLDRALKALLADATSEQKRLSKLLLEAAKLVAVNGETSLPSELVKRIKFWDRKRQKSWDEVRKDVEIRRAVKWSSGTKVRDPKSGKSAFEAAAAKHNISRYTAEKRAYRKRRR